MFERWFLRMFLSLFNLSLKATSVSLVALLILFCAFSVSPVSFSNRWPKFLARFKLIQWYNNIGDTSLHPFPTTFHHVVYSFDFPDQRTEFFMKLLKLTPQSLWRVKTESPSSHRYVYVWYMLQLLFSAQIPAPWVLLAPTALADLANSVLLLQQHHGRCWSPHFDLWHHCQSYSFPSFPSSPL